MFLRYWKPLVHISVHFKHMLYALCFLNAASHKRTVKLTNLFLLITNEKNWSISHCILYIFLQSIKANAWFSFIRYNAVLMFIYGRYYYMLNKRRWIYLTHDCYLQNTFWIWKYNGLNEYNFYKTVCNKEQCE